MIRAIFARIRRKLEERQEPRSVDVLIAKRALRLHNRSAEGAAKYARVQTILFRGPDAEIRR